MFGSAAPQCKRMFAMQLLLSNICSPPPACGTDTDPAPQLPAMHSRGTKNRRLWYQDHFSWLKKKYPGRKICHKKRPASHLVMVPSFSTTTKYKEIVVLIRPYSVSTFSTWSRLDSSSPQQMEKMLIQHQLLRHLHLMLQQLLFLSQ